MTLTHITPFVEKFNAKYQGDPNGTYVLAEDINLIQDAVNNLEKMIGIHPESDSLSSRISSIEKNGALRTDSFLLYKGNPLQAYSIEEAIHYFSYIPVLVLSKNEEAAFTTFLSSIQKRKSRVYGYIDCSSVNSLAVIQLEMEWWKSKGAVGVFLDKFDYSFENTRNRQLDILGSAQERHLSAIVTGAPEYILLNQEHEKNPEWLPLTLTPDDGYYLPNLFIGNGKKKTYDEVLTYAKVLAKAKKDTHIHLYTEDTATGSSSETQALYEHGHSLALLFDLDGYGLTQTDNYQLSDPVRFHDWSPFVGGWKEAEPEFVEGVADIRRRTTFGEIIYVKSSNTVVYTGITIPASVLKWQANTIPGTAIADGTIEDKKIKEYDGNRVIQGINKDGVTEKIKLARLQDIGFDDIQGDINANMIKAHVIEAINANIGHAKIDSAVIGTLTAGHITADVIEAINIAADHAEIGNAYIHGAVIDHLDAGSIKTGTLEAEHITSSVVNALNLNAGHAKIDSALIGELHADSITANVVEAINIYAQNISADKAKISNAVISELKSEHIVASVIEAVNLNAGHAKIDSAVIGQLESQHIETAVIKAINANIGKAVIDEAMIGALSADKIKANVVEAINLYAKEMTAGSAKIDVATIGELTAKHIEASVIKALEANIGKATIDSALIGALTADHIKAEIIKAINLSAETATINNAKIGALDADHITASVIEAINANIGTAFIGGGIIKEGTIMDAHISTLNANKLTAGTVDTSKVTVSGSDGHLVMKDNQITIYDDVDGQGMRRKRVVLGKDDVTGKGSYGLVVMGKDGKTLLYDDTGVYNAGIQQNAVSNEKLQDSAVDGRVLKAGSVFADHIVAGNITGEKIAGNSILASHLQAGIVTSDKLFSGGKLRSVSDNKPTTNVGGTLTAGGPCARGTSTGYWTGTTNNTLTVDLGSAIADIREISFTTYPASGNTFPKGYKIEGSLDNTAWTELGKETANTLPIMVHTLDYSGKLRYIRITITANNTGTSSVIANLEVKSLEGGTLISGDLIRTGTIDANLVKVTNIQAEAISVGKNTKFEEGYNPFTIGQNAVMKGQNYNGINITPEKGIEVISASNTINLNATSGIEILNSKITSGDKRVFFADGNGNVTLKGNIIMQGGSISWDNLTGQNPTKDANNTVTEMKGNTTISGMFVDQNGKLVLNADSILAGKVKADYITVGSKTTYEAGYDPTKFKNGGTNILSYSGMFQDTSGWALNQGKSMEVIEENGVSILKSVGSIKQTLSYTLKPNTEYIYSAELKFSADMTSNNMSPLHCWTAQGTSSHTATKTYYGPSTLKANEWNRVYIKILTAPTGDTLFTALIYSAEINANNITCYVKNVQLEEGNQLTPWSPSPEDVKRYSDDVSSISKSIRVRYIRDWSAGNSENSVNHWVQMKVFQGATNVAAGKIPTSNATLTNPERLTNGNIATGDYVGGVTGNALQYVQLDLGQVYHDIDYIQVWHYYSMNNRVYNKTKIEVSEDGVKWTRVFDSAVSGTYVETSKGIIATVNAGSVVGSTTTRLETIDGQITASVEEQKTIKDNVSKVSGRLDVMSDKVSIVVKEENGKNVIDGTALVGAINVTPGTVQIEGKNVNLKGAVTFESLDKGVSDKLNSSITQDDALGLIQKTYNNGIYMKQDYISFTTAKANCLYIHGFNKNGDPADVDGFIMVNGVKQAVTKGKLEPGVTGEGYIMYSTISNVWFMTKYDGTSGKWFSYNVGSTAHGKELALDDRFYFVGYISI